MSVQVFDLSGNKVGQEEIPAEFDTGKINEHVIWEVVTAEQASQRQGTHKTKTKGEVRGGGAKPWRQKGTGRARSGSNRSPIWPGGGTVFGPQPRSYRKDITRKKKLSGLRNIIARKLQQEQVILISDWSVDAPSTSAAFKSLDSILNAAPFAEKYKENRKLRTNTNDKRRKITVVVADNDQNRKKSLRNLPWVELIHCDRLAALPLFYNHGLIFDKKAWENTKERFKKG